MINVLTKQKLMLSKTALILSVVMGVLATPSFISSPVKLRSASKTPICDSVPLLNKQIVAYIDTKINQKVGEGECWDLAAEALNTVGAKWDHEYKFGREINLKHECAMPGDIMQFKNVRIDYKLNNFYYHERMPDHTAIIYEVEAQDNFNIAEQNTGRLGQKVGITPLNLNYIKSGKFKVYRPVKN
jgi:hypothetical protein